MTVDLITYCCPKDIHNIYANFYTLVSSFKYIFNDIILISQRCRGIDAGDITIPCRILETEDYTWEAVCDGFNILVDDPDAERATAGIAHAGKVYYWKNIILNPFIGLKESNADYVVLMDGDCELDRDILGNSWVDRGIRKLQSDRSIFMIGPHQRQATVEGFKTQNISQILFLSERQRLLNLNYSECIPDGEYTGFRAIYNHIFEGRLWRYAMQHNEYRAILAGPPWLIHHAW